MTAITVNNLTKRYGPRLAVDHVSFDVRPGRITGFLGPNGSGKSTTLRMLVGLTAPTSGGAWIDGRPYRELPDPIRTVGVALDSDSFHPGRTAAQHLRVLASAAGLAPGRRAAQTLVEGALDQVDLAGSASQRVGTFSLGMKQRLALATALLGDPELLILDEPLNGLDPDGIRWLRELLRRLAGEGRTVLLSSHLLAEAAQTVDDVVVVSAGRLVGGGALDELVPDRHDLENWFLELIHPRTLEVCKS